LKERAFAYDFDKTWVPEIDDMFDNAGKILETCEKARVGWIETVDEIMEITDVGILQKPDIVEALKVFFWSVGANNEGQIVKAGLKISDSMPFIELNCWNCYWDVWRCNEALTEFLRTTFEMPQQIIETMKSIETIAQNITSFNPATAIENSDLNPFDKAKATVRFAANSKKLVENMAKIKKMPDIIKEATNTMKLICSKFKELTSKQCDDIGIQAYKASQYHPYEIIRAYHPGPKKSPEELKKWEEAKNANDCTCPKCDKERQQKNQKPTKKE